VQRYALGNLNKCHMCDQATNKRLEKMIFGDSRMGWLSIDVHRHTLVPVKPLVTNKKNPIHYVNFLF